MPLRFGPDGVAHVPVLVRGRFYGDVWIDAEIIGADPVVFCPAGFRPAEIAPSGGERHPLFSTATKLAV